MSSFPEMESALRIKNERQSTAMALPVIPILKIVAELAASANGIGSQWLKSRDNSNNKDMHTRLNVLEAFYTKQVQLVENMAKEMNDIALLIQKQVDINNDQIKYINNLKTAVIVLSVFLFICIITIGYLIFTKP
jgi:septum formation topological specificity factor MinE